MPVPQSSPAQVAHSAHRPPDPPPAALIDAIVRDARHDAECVADLLDALGIARENAAAPPVALPASFLLALGAAMRLLRWEEQGLTLHRQAGSSGAGAALFKLATLTSHPETRALHDTKVVVMLFLNAQIDLSVTRLAWSAVPIVGGDVVLGEADEDDLITAIAALAWAQRRSQLGHDQPHQRPEGE